MFRRFEVVIPPTSLDVEKSCFDAMKNRTKVSLVAQRELTPDILPTEILELNSELPKNTQLLGVDFKIDVTRHRDDGSIIILGETIDGESINLRTDPNPKLPATLTCVENWDYLA